MMEGLKLLYIFLTKGIKMSDLTSAIALLDNDKDGYISIKELYECIKQVINR